jgi:hypothetical protein
VRRHPESAIKLRDVIDEYNDYFDQCALKSVARLSESSDAAEAFERLKLKNAGDGFLLLAAIIDAEKPFKEFRQQVIKANSTLARMERLANAHAELRKFVGELAEGARLHSLFATIERQDVAAIKRGLKLIANKIEAKRCAVKEVTPQLGITRKTQSKEAAENAAIWMLAKAVRSTTGKPHVREVADFAQVLLGKEVFFDRVRHIVRNRRQRYHEAVDAQTRRLTPVFNERTAKLKRHGLRERQKAAGSSHRKMCQRASGAGTVGDIL